MHSVRAAERLPPGNRNVIPPTTLLSKIYYVSLTFFYFNLVLSKNSHEIGDLINSELMNRGGVADEDIPKNMIMFYQSFYGLRANNLSKFAPPEHSV